MAWKFSPGGEIYVQIAQRYENYIKLGVLKNGDKLPSVRSAAEECGVNPNTAARAYSLLEERGFITSIPKKGVYVAYAGEKNDERKKYITEVITDLKKQGIPYELLQEAVKTVYERGENDD